MWDSTHNHPKTPLPVAEVLKLLFSHLGLEKGQKLVTFLREDLLINQKRGKASLYVTCNRLVMSSHRLIAGEDISLIMAMQLPASQPALLLCPCGTPEYEAPCSCSSEVDTLLGCRPPFRPRRTLEALHHC